MSDYSLFTSESVSEGHPDKMSDQISDAILDTYLTKDPDARVAVETLVKTGMVVVAGEVTTSAAVTTGELEEVIRQTVLDIGFDSSDVCFDGNTCAVINAIGQQSADIALGTHEADEANQGAGDQGLMFGFASDETDVLMPAPIHYSHRLVEKQAELRKSGALPWLRPDAKSQITLRYAADGKPERVEAVVLSTQHAPDISQEDLREAVRKDIIEATLPAEWLHADTLFHINPTGNFVIGGPQGDCGLTGERLLLIPTVAWRAMEVGLSRARTLPRSIAPRPMPGVTSPRILLQRAWPAAARCRCPTLLASRNPPQFQSTLSVQQPLPMTRSLR